jgi:hypothetical protein
MSVRTTPPMLTQPVFTTETTPAARLAACKAYLDTEGQRIRERHQAGEPGRQVARALSDRMDGLLVPLFTTALAAWRNQHGEPPAPVCLVALGGYGRAELSPLSDVDVMFLYPEVRKTPELAKFQEHLSNGILYPLWDLKLKIGHSTRTLPEVFAEAGREIKTKTALLESRFLAGSATLASTTSRTTPRPTSSRASATRAAAAPSTATPFSSRNPTSRTASAACATTRTPCGCAACGSASRAWRTWPGRITCNRRNSATCRTPTTSSSGCATSSIT